MATDGLTENARLQPVFQHRTLRLTPRAHLALTFTPQQAAALRHAGYGVIALAPIHNKVPVAT